MVLDISGEGTSPHERSAEAQTAIRPSYDYAYYRGVFRGREMPFAYLDLNLLDANIREIVVRAAGKRVRLASKSLRSVPVMQRILAADDCFQGIMCYSAPEAIFLVRQGFQDLLLGYPVWHEQQIAAVAQETAAGAQITLMIDSIEHVDHIEQIAGKYGVRLPLCLDLDMASDIPGLHFGVWRSPLRTTEQVRPVVERILNASHVWLDGVMGYEAQIAGVGDHYVGQALKNTFVRVMKKRSLAEVRKRRQELIKVVRSYKVPLRFVNGGGTGSIATTREEADVTEITVGSGFYSPTLFDNYRDFRYRPATGYAIEIVRLPGRSLYTCQGGGYVASGTGKDKLPQPYLPVGAHLHPIEGAGEVQTPIRYEGPEKLDLGDPIFMRHAKAGELCERFTRLLLVENGTVVGEASTYRGDGQCFI